MVYRRSLGGQAKPNGNSMRARIYIYYIYVDVLSAYLASLPVCPIARRLFYFPIQNGR